MNRSHAAVLSDALARAWRTGLAPRRVSLVQAVGEAVLGWLVLGSLSGVLWRRTAVSGNLELRALFTAIAWLWLLLWPLWRMRPTPGRNWWIRKGRGIVHLLLIGGLIATVVGVVQSSGSGGLSLLPTAGIAGALLYLLPAACVRALLAAVVPIRQWVRGRLYRQLVISHLSVILISLVAVTAGGIGISLALAALTWPDAPTQTELVVEALSHSTSGSTIDTHEAQATLDELSSGQIRPGLLSRTPVLLLVPWRVLNRRTQMLNRQGTVIAAVRTGGKDGPCGKLAATAPLPSPVRDALLRGALAGTVTTEPVPDDLSCGVNARDQFLAAAPLYTGLNTRPAGVLIIQGTRSSALISNILPFALVSASAASLLLIAVIVLPGLALSALASYLFARGLTRRMEEVSQAAEAIAAGDLSKRAPVTTENEIGRLATDFNRMAASQEQAIAELQQARAQAEQALRARQDLMAGVSHELRTPIAIVQAQLESLQLQQIGDSTEGVPPAVSVASDTIEALQGELQRLAGLVDDLFALARVETGALHLVCIPTDVTPLVRDVAALLRPLAKRESAVTLAVDLAPVLPPALVDGDRLRQILANLVRNAIRHTPEGGIISLNAFLERDWLVLSVADTGEGIDPEHLPRIFERFYRVDPSRARGSGGAGLGLAIVREFVEEMGGKVTVESIPGEGTCFQVYLRIATRDAVKQDPVQSESYDLETAVS